MCNGGGGIFVVAVRSHDGHDDRGERKEFRGGRGGGRGAGAPRG